ncbi:hypothetical protein [Empedobacter brevis]|uniref:hypothetical protein n=1 Tax=Empedobacter brevis TaxID=247 RepID=UPI0028AFE671|nr:hypothetical protein [Empedobacter brevis]
MKSITLYFFQNQVEKIEKYLNLAIEDIDDSIKQIDKSDKNYYYDEIFEDVNKIEVLELMIINLHKVIEKLIAGELKRLSKDHTIKTFKKYKVFEKFDKDFNINLKEISYYKSYLELTFIANEIKHGNLISYFSKLKTDLIHGNDKIINNRKNEIINLNVPNDLLQSRIINYDNLQKFYTRVKKEVFFFSEELIKESEKYD